MAEHKAHISNWKKVEVSRVEKLLSDYKVIAVADMTNMPSHQLQKLRSSLKDSVNITMTKGSLINIALNNLKSKLLGVDKLIGNIRGMPAILMTNSNPFRLAKLLKKSKSTAPAKAGQIAPNDIIIPAGPTAFPPGPIIGELGSVGLKTGVVDGKVAVKEDKLVVKEGELISPQVARVLAKLGIEPMEIGINLLAAYEAGTIFTKDTLNIDDTEVLNNIKLAAQSTFNLAAFIAYPTKDNIKLLVSKAYRSTISVAKKGNIPTPETVKESIEQAHLEAEHLKNKFSLPTEDNDVKKKRDLVEEAKIEKSQIQKEEEAAQAVLKRLQDQKIGSMSSRNIDKDFEQQEKKAQELLKKLQDEKIKKGDKKK